MKSNLINDVKERLKLGGYYLQLNMTGGGSHFLYELTNSGGISKFFMGCWFPYDQETQSFLFSQPKKYVSKEYAKSLCTGTFGRENLTIGVTAQMVKPLEREGRFNGAFVCLHEWDNDKTHEIEIQFQSKSREEQEIELSERLCEFIIDSLS